MYYDIDNRQNKYEITDEMEKLIVEVIKECLSVEGKSDEYEVSISFVDNEEIRILNRDYRGVDKETDVLSFPMEDEFSLATPILGDIVISVEKAIEQAEDYGHSFYREMTFLTVHSMFHLMGYDHMEEEDRKIMRNKEESVMTKLGIKRV